MPVLPFHRYIGPGNPIDSGPCVDEDDCIARQHDVKYEKARTPREIREADVEAIHEFRANWLAGNWHSLIGDIGLSLKYCVETYTGVLYPKLGEYQPCEIVSLFHDLLKLHCVNKPRPFNRYINPLNTPEFDYRVYKILQTYDLTKSKISDGIYFYVIVAWYKLYHKNEIYINKNSNHTVRTNNKIEIPQQKAQIVKHYDIFNIKTWIRFFALFQANKPQPPDNYNDEEFSNMFMQYD